MSDPLSPPINRREDLMTLLVEMSAVLRRTKPLSGTIGGGGGSSGGGHVQGFMPEGAGREQDDDRRR